MLSSLLSPSRPSPKATRSERSLFSSPFGAIGPSTGTRRNDLNGRRRIDTGYDESESVSESEEEIESGNGQETEEDITESEQNEDGPADTTPLLPIFSAALLDALPVYNLTHVVRLLVVSRCETTLSWEQLRSPQVSQFLLKPIQQEIRSRHFSAATEYALMANCLQFQKEGNMNPGYSGTSQTRAMVCELLAIKLLKEYNTRELIDALSYDFDPLQDQTSDTQVHLTSHPRLSWEPARKVNARSARISCLEVAIRAQSKRFLAHPLVVQQLEAIWAGSIVFHSAADSMHRRPVREVPNRARGYGTGAANSSFDQARPDVSPSKPQPATPRENLPTAPVTIRRAVTLYNPRDASLFKLSRLRVPKYRSLLSTCSFAVLLSLFLAVLIQRSLEITNLEVFFWFWAAGYMLDEIVGFNEQGFALYVASFWNTFDLGILMVLLAHLALRLYGIVMPDVRKHHVAGLAYDVLAADAILLFPRLFSVLDHYRYFSQLLIAFRMMASDLMAVFVLIIISCSGFFVALTLSFENGAVDTPSSVAYALLQILMGFTPAAWDRWAGYNVLGKTILTLFLFICHFLVVTILITVLTNSFMAIVRNANEEHQFVFAVNTISMVKSDALFSHVAPFNILAWMLTPLRYFIPFRQFVKVNRTVIKMTHFPILFLIYLYERTILRSSVFEPIDLVGLRGRVGIKKSFSQKLPRLSHAPSVATFRQDRALEEVFRRPFDSTMRHSVQSQERRQTSNVVNNWMKNIDGDVPSPHDQDRIAFDELEGKRSRRPSNKFPRSVASDPADLRSRNEFLSPGTGIFSDPQTTPSYAEGQVQQTDADGDDELVTNDNEDDDAITLDPRSSRDDRAPHFPGPEHIPQADYFSRQEMRTAQEPGILNSPSPSPSSVPKARLLPQSLQRSPTSTESLSKRSPKWRPAPHLRNTSTATMLYSPVVGPSHDKSSSPGKRKSPTATSPPKKSHLSALASGAISPRSKPTSVDPGHHIPKKGVPRVRPVLPTKEAQLFRSAPPQASFDVQGHRSRSVDSRRAGFNLDIVSDIGDGKAIGGGYVGAIPASFATQMAYATGGLRQQPSARNEDQDMLGRLMLARMNTLEESFREIVHEMRDHLRRDSSRSRSHERAGRHLHRANRKGKDKQHGGNKENRDPNRAGQSPGQQAMASKRAEPEWVDEPEEKPEMGNASI